MKIAVVMMQRDETDLLGPWIDYHIALLGPAAIHIIDNGSTNDVTRAGLARARAAGITVHDAPTREDFKRKGPLVQEIGKSLAADYDWIVPIDGDEFLGSYRDGAFAADLAGIKASLAILDAAGQPVARVNHAFWNIPGATEMYYKKVHKVVFRPEAPIALDKGFHQYDSKGHRSVVPEGLEGLSSLCFLHFHNRHYVELLRSARYKLEGQVNDFRRKTLIAFKGAGKHVTRYFLKDVRVKAPESAEIWDAAAMFGGLGITMPFAAEAPPIEPRVLEKLLDPVNLLRHEERARMTTEEITLFRDLLFDAETYFEIGHKGTARMVCEAGVQRVVSVQADIDSMQNQAKEYNLLKFIHASRLQMRHVELGDLDDRGNPHVPPSPRRIEIYLDQVREVPFDVALVDGPYRIAAAATAFIAGAEGARVVMRDYLDDPAVNPLTQLYDIAATAGRLSVLTRKPGVPHRTARKIIRYYTETV